MLGKALAVLTLLLAPAGLNAGVDGLVPWLFQKHHCQPSMYNRLNYWAPSVYRVNARLHPQDQLLYPPNTTPCLVPGYQTMTYPCPAASPPTHPYGDPAAASRIER